MSGTTTILADEAVIGRAADNWHFEALAGAAALPAIHDEWQRLARALPNQGFFQRPEWFESYLSAFSSAGSDTFVIRMKREGALIGFVPLVRTTRLVAGLRLRSLELPSGPHLLLCDAVYPRTAANERAVGELVRYLRHDFPHGWDVLFLPNLPEDGCFQASLNVAPPRLMISRPQSRCDWLPVEPFEKLSAGFSKNFRGNLRKARNKLQALPGVEFVSATGAGDLPGALAAFLDIEASGWKGAAGTSSAIKLDPQTTSFYRALASTFSRSGDCEVNLLSVEGRPVAGQFCLIAGETSYILKIAYDEEFAQLAPGNMLLEQTIQRYNRDGRIRRINLVTDAAWHSSWKPESVALSDAMIFNSGPRGLAAYALLIARRSAAKIYRTRVRPALDRLRRKPAAAVVSAGPPDADGNELVNR